MDRDNLSPAEAIEAVRRHRGDQPGPPPDVTLPNDRLPPPVQGLVERGDTALAPAAPVTSLAPSLGLDGRPTGDQGDGVSLTQGIGSFEGHAIVLTDGESKRLRAFLAEVAQRQLEDEFKRLKQHRIVKGKEAI